MTTLKDIAEETGFSIKTVSRAIHNHPDIKEETKIAIMEVVRRRSFTPNWAAQSLRSQRTNTIGFVVPNITNGFFGEIGIAIDEFFRSRSYSTLICFTSNSRSNEVASIQSLLAKKIDGIILAPVGQSGDFLDRIPNLGETPLVLIDNRLTGPPRNYVLQDNVRNAALLTNHVLGHGHRRVGFVTGPLEESSARERLDGFRSALEAQGMAFDEALVRSVGWEIKDGFDATLSLLDEGSAPRPTALIYASSQLLLGGYRALQEVGLSIPSNVAVASFEHPDVIDALSPRPTTLEKIEAKIGLAASTMLLSLIEAKGELLPPEVLIPGELIVGGSCGCPSLR